MGKYLDSDKEALERAEKGIKHWGLACVMASELIAEVKERELWKLKYDSWRDFCEVGCGITKQWANQILVARRATKEISEFVDVSTTKSGKTPETQFPLASENLRTPTLTPRQAKALEGLTTEQKSKVIKASQLDGSKVSHESIVTSRKTIEKVIELDSEGYPIPERALEFWERRQEIQDLLTGISRLRGILERALEQKDKMFGEVVLQGAIIDLSNVYTNVNRAKPYVVCTACQGRLPDKCTFCKGRGIISKFAWETLVPKEIKNIRMKSIKV